MATKLYELFNPKTQEVVSQKRGTKKEMKKLKVAMGSPWQVREFRMHVPWKPLRSRKAKG